MKIFNSGLALISLFFLIVLNSCLKSNEPIEDIKLKENDEAIQAFLKSKNITAQKTADGIYYVITKTNSLGKTPVAGDLIKFQYLASRLDGFKLDSSTTDKAGYSPYGTVDNLWSYVASFMKEGEKISLFLPYKFAYGTQATANLPAYSPITLDFMIEKLRTEEEQIDSYLEERKIISSKTQSGLRYSVSNPIANGDSLKNGQKVTVKYTGKLLYYSTIVDATGKITNIFDSGTYSFTLGNGESVSGFDEGVKKLKVGEKGIIAFPSSLGYKDVAQSKFPAKTPLMFEIEVVSAQ